MGLGPTAAELGDRRAERVLPRCRGQQQGADDRWTPHGTDRSGRGQTEASPLHPVDDACGRVESAVNVRSASLPQPLLSRVSRGPGAARVLPRSAHAGALRPHTQVPPVGRWRAVSLALCPLHRDRHCTMTGTAPTWTSAGSKVRRRSSRRVDDTPCRRSPGPYQFPAYLHKLWMKLWTTATSSTRTRVHTVAHHLPMPRFATPDRP